MSDKGRVLKVYKNKDAKTPLERLVQLSEKGLVPFKAGKGKYVAPAPIENRINKHPMVDSCMVSGVGQQSAYAIVIPAEELRPKLSDPAVRVEMEKAMGKLLSDVNAQLVDYEQLRMIVVMSEPWSIENGCLTPTMKIKRNRIESAVEAKVDGWYHAKGPVVWA